MHVWHVNTYISIINIFSNVISLHAKTFTFLFFQLYSVSALSDKKRNMQLLSTKAYVPDEIKRLVAVPATRPRPSLVQPLQHNTHRHAVRIRTCACTCTCDVWSMLHVHCDQGWIMNIEVSNDEGAFKQQAWGTDRSVVVASSRPWIWTFRRPCALQENTNTIRYTQRHHHN